LSRLHLFLLVLLVTSKISRLAPLLFFFYSSSQPYHPPHFGLLFPPPLPLDPPLSLFFQSPPPIPLCTFPLRSRAGSSRGPVIDRDLEMQDSFWFVFSINPITSFFSSLSRPFFSFSAPRLDCVIPLLYLALFVYFLFRSFLLLSFPHDTARSNQSPPFPFFFVTRFHPHPHALPSSDPTPNYLFFFPPRPVVSSSPCFASSCFFPLIFF